MMQTSESFVKVDMIGVLNQCIESFIVDTFGADRWAKILAKSGVQYPWVSTCPYSDKITYTLAITAAEVLGIKLNEALEALGVYFVTFVFKQGYEKLLTSLGSDLVEFLTNLNSLHLHLLATFPAMMAPSFRCESLKEGSLELHYYSHRPALWPLAAGIIKGVANTIYKHNPSSVNVELLSGRDCLHHMNDHEVLLVTFPAFPTTVSRRLGAGGIAGFDNHYAMHPFHILIDEQGCLIQSGHVLQRLSPGLKRGALVDDTLNVAHPHLECERPFSSIEGWGKVLKDLHSPFLLNVKTESGPLLLKGQMFHQPHEGGLLFIGTPRVSSLDDLKASSLYISDFPLHDMSRDFLLLAEQRSIEVELKERLETMTHSLRDEKARSDALIQRMALLLNCFPFEGKPDHQSGGSSKAGPSTPPSLPSATALTSELANQEVVEAVRRSINPQLQLGSRDFDDIVILEPLSKGSYGEVSRGLWQGVEVALKTMILPPDMSGGQKRERMAIMEAAISAALSHPNIIQTFTYTIRPLKSHYKHIPLNEPSFALSQDDSIDKGIIASDIGSSAMLSSDSCLPKPQGGHVDKDRDQATGFEVLLVMELCDLGSLRSNLDNRIFELPDGSLNYAAVLDCSIEVTKALMHLHRQNIIHADIKANNVMLKTSVVGGKIVVCAKLADFGLSTKVSENELEIKGKFQGTITFMSPELISTGTISKASDIYALGIFLWEVYTADSPFKNCPRHLYNHLVTVEDKRPAFPSNVPEPFTSLVRWCWAKDPSSRPSVVEVLSILLGLRKAISGATPSVNLKRKEEVEKIHIAEHLRITENQILAGSVSGSQPHIDEEEQSYMDTVYGVAPAGQRANRGSIDLMGHPKSLRQSNTSTIRLSRHAPGVAAQAGIGAHLDHELHLELKSCTAASLPSQPVAASILAGESAVAKDQGDIPEGIIMGNIQESQWL